MAKKSRSKTKTNYPVVHRKMGPHRDYKQYHTNVGAFGRLVIPVFERKRLTIEHAADTMGLRKESFEAVLRGREKTLVMSVGQATKLAEFLDLDPVRLIEAYLWDATRVKLAPTVAHTYTDLYLIFQWYRAHLGHEVVEDREVLEDLSAVLYLYEVYRKVRADDQVYLAFRKTLNAFMETMEVQVPDVVVLGS